jgi:putative cardiolipin synthase
MQPLIVLVILFLSLFARAENEVELLISRKQAFDARLELIQNETKSIRYNTFTFALDNAGKEILGQMVSAAQRGVKVKLILDGMDIDAGLVSRPSYLEALKNYGVEVKIYNPLYRHLLSANNRNHIKVLIGSDTLINGGRNTEINYFTEFLDVEAKVSGHSVKLGKASFDQIWYSEFVKPPVYTASTDEVLRAQKEIKNWIKDAQGKKYVTQKKSVKVEHLTYHSDPPNPSEKKKTGIKNDVLKMFTEAQSSLEIFNPYVLFSPEQKKELEAAIQRGVKVKIYTNSAEATDSKLVAMAWEIKKHELVELGAEVHESNRYIHGKTIIRDGEEIFIGSKNFDMRSQNLNLENGIKFKSKFLAKKLSKHQERLRKMFMTNLQKKSVPETKAGICTMNGLRRLITELAYPHL